MREAVASDCRGGSIDPPAVRPSFLRSTPGHRPSPQISNRDTLRLEMSVTQRKQTLGAVSNRDKNAIFATSKSRRPPRNAGCQPAFLAQLNQAPPIPTNRNRIRAAIENHVAASRQKILIDTIPKLEFHPTRSKQTTEVISNRYKLKAGTFTSERRVE